MADLLQLDSVLDWQFSQGAAILLGGAPPLVNLVNDGSCYQSKAFYTCAFCKMLFTRVILRLEPMSFFTYGSRSIGKSWQSLSFTRSTETNTFISNFLILNIVLYYKYNTLYLLSNKLYTNLKQLKSNTNLKNLH